VGPLDGEGGLADAGRSRDGGDHGCPARLAAPRQQVVQAVELRFAAGEVVQGGRQLCRHRWRHRHGGRLGRLPGRGIARPRPAQVRIGGQHPLVKLAQ
jgi:hypothetical protein